MDRQPEVRPRGGRRGLAVRVSPWLAWFICLLCVALSAGSLLLAALNGRTMGEIFVGEAIVTIASLTVAFSVVGALIASHRPETALGWIFCSAALFQGFSNCGYEYAIYALITKPGSLPLGAEAAWLGQWIWAPGLGLILVFLPLLFPDGRLLSRRWRPVAWLGGLSIILISTMGAILLWPERGPALVRDEGAGEEGTSHVLFVVVDRIAFPMMLVAGLGAVISLFIRFRRARGDERQQIKWFASTSALTFVFVFVFEVLVNTEGRLLGVVFAGLSLPLVSAVPVATGIAILRHRLYDIDLLVNRTLVYGSLTGMLAALYLGSVVLLRGLIFGFTGRPSQLVVVASTLAVAALFGPLRRRIQSAIDRRFYRSKYDAAKTLAAFGARLRDETDLDGLCDDLVDVVRRCGRSTPHCGCKTRRTKGGAGREKIPGGGSRNAFRNGGETVGL